MDSVCRLEWSHVLDLSPPLPGVFTSYPPYPYQSQMKMLHRSLIVSRIVFKNIDPVILIGLGIGLLGGLGLAIGGNLLSSHIMDSYQSFLQHSLIGMRGSLVLKTNTTQHLNRFQQAWTGHPEYPSSPTWFSQGAQSIQFSQAPQTWKRQIRI